MKKYLYLLVSQLLFAGHVFASEPVSVVNMRCEYLTEPLGIDMHHPRLSWELISGGKNKKQTARQILVATNPALLVPGKADVWDSGKTNSNETNQIPLEGGGLKPFAYYYWKVAVWDEQGKQSAWSPIAKFSTGAFSKDDWKAQWIGEDEAAMLPETKYYSYEGYISFEESQAFTVKWVIIDMEKQVTIDEIKLYPIEKRETVFPLHFKVEIADRSDFFGARVIAGELNESVDLKTLPYIKKLSAPQTGRYVRMTVTKMPAAGRDSYAYGLSEIELLYQGKNLALNKPVTASDTKWPPGLLTDGYLQPEGKGYFNDMPPSPLLRKEINIHKKVKQALYLTSALGIYEAYINGKKVGKQIMAPEWTDYDNHVQYQTHEVGHLLKNGTNVLGAMLADGWYAGARWSHPGRGGYGGFARKFIGQLVIDYEDGTSEVIGTDKSWKYLAQGPITSVTFFGGEEYNANNEQKGWDKAGFDDSKWDTPLASPVNTLPERANGKYVLCAQMNEPIAVIVEIKPVSVRKIGENKYIFDMGQNMVGWCRLSLPYNPNRDVTFRFAEMLNDDGTLYMDNMRGAKPIDIYRPAGEKRIDYEPRFTYHGFRFVEVDGLTKTPGLNNILGKMVASSSPVTGSFVTSNKDINKLWENIRWTQWGNMISVPTDCPQRDEREGWTADAQIFAQTGIYNLDMAGFYTKWVRDIRDNQLPDGRLPDVSPVDGAWLEFYNSPGWADAGVIIPWRVYQNYNDTVILSKQYDCMKRFIDFIHRRNPDLLWRFSRGRENMFGDWLNGDEIRAADYPRPGGRVPNYVFSTAYFAYSTSLLAKAARQLGKEDDEKYYTALAGSIRKTFVDNYVSNEGVIEGNTQAGYAMALEFDILPEDLRAKAAAHMVESIKKYDGRMSTGIHTTIRLMNQLSEYRYTDVAYQLLTSRRLPSWFYSLDQGATTIWERWDGYVAGRGFQNPGMNSFNHVAFGAIGEWMYRHILGIQYDESQPGYRHFFIKPQPGKLLEWAKGSYRSINGTIEVSWTRKNNVFTLEVTVPVNTEATVILPDGMTQKAGSGKHRYNLN